MNFKREFRILGNPGWGSSLLTDCNLNNRKEITHVPKTHCSYRLSFEISPRWRQKSHKHTSAWGSHKFSIFLKQTVVTILDSSPHRLSDWMTIPCPLNRGRGERNAFKWQGSPGSTGAAVQRGAQPSDVLSQCCLRTTGAVLIFSPVSKPPSLLFP